MKEQSWKDCIPQKGIEGSNPSLSVFYLIVRQMFFWRGFFGRAFLLGVFRLPAKLKGEFGDCVFVFCGLVTW